MATVPARSFTHPWRELQRRQRRGNRRPTDGDVFSEYMSAFEAFSTRRVPDARIVWFTGGSRFVLGSVA